MTPHKMIRAILAITNASGDPSMPSQQLLLLLALYESGEIPQSQLERVTGVKRSSNSRNIYKLRTWVENFEDPKNRTTKIVRLTTVGRIVMDAAMEQTK